MAPQVVERRAIVQFFANEGWPTSAISRATKYSYNFCWRWSRRSDVHRYPGSGRKVKLTRQILAKIRVKLKRYGGKSSIREVAQELSLSHPTVLRGAKQTGVKFRMERPVPAITDAQAKARVTFAKTFRNHIDWDKVVFIDEKTFQVGGSGARRGQWVDSDAKPPTRSVRKYPGKINVLGGISAEGITSLEIFKDNMTAEMFVDMLDRTIVHGANQLYPDRQWTLLMDSDPKHTAKLTTQYLDSTDIDYFSKSEWPANSPDLNLIENAWGYIESRMQKNPPKTVEELKKRVSKEWASLPDEYLKNLASSMDGRLKKVIAAKGQAIGY